MIGPSHQLEDRRYSRDPWKDFAAILFGISPNSVTRELRSDAKWTGNVYLYTYSCRNNGVTRALRLTGFKLPADMAWTKERAAEFEAAWARVSEAWAAYADAVRRATPRLIFNLNET